MVTRVDILTPILYMDKVVVGLPSHGGLRATSEHLGRANGASDESGRECLE